MTRQCVPEKYLKGWEDGKAGRDPDSAELAYGSHVCNSYERGYIDSGYFDEPQEGVNASPALPGSTEVN